MLLLFVFLLTWILNTNALSISTRISKKALLADLQKSYTPESIIDNVGKHVSVDIDPEGSVASLVLVRLSKQLIALDNNGDPYKDSFDAGTLGKIVQSFASSNWNSSAQAREAATEGTKASAVLSKLLSLQSSNLWEPLLKKWKDTDAGEFEPHQISGIAWSFDVLSNDYNLPIQFQEAFDNLGLPFRIRANMCGDFDGLTVFNLVDQVNFRTEEIRTKSNKTVRERRQTAWEGDDHVAPFAYSGKNMDRDDWSPLVKTVRDHLNKQTGQYYDGCLLNLYPDGGSGMRYHIDPDQGTLWAFETAVVSVGCTRRFAFREIPSSGSSSNAKPHVFVLFQGDVTEMFADCQTRFQHTVRTAESKNENAPRASLVFKRTL
ncbi:unnamed protein product [Cylindrotheca closterium]|uniref:Fe2OG dioxygenase domain-containing protein n=1 Tax=Cylindrotheca closterium TaxID=2856 RepID=A0AAD2FRJ4_9STRA|nr:unnamed protein product [Cylindrotheca closterium]